VAVRAQRKTKVIGTIGPACEAVDTIQRMIAAGMNVARFNFSHGSHEEHARRLEALREAAERLGANVASMMDTKGVEIRTGAVENGRVELVEGSLFALTVEKKLGSRHGVSISYTNLPHEVKLGSTVLLDDGLIELRVVGIEEASVRCEVIRGGELGNHKGVNIPDAVLALNAMSPENQADLVFAVRHGIDYVAASFVRGPSDVVAIRSFLAAQGSPLPIIAKIENKEGVRNLDEIVRVADGTMVARGDLGVELPVQEVPLVQKKIIRTTVASGKPVITATQMLDSMERNPRPTRAEVSDVANAILDGTSAVMLSGETAKGRYPVEAVRTMATLALQAEASLREYGDLQQITPNPSNVVTEAVSQAAITMAHHLKAAAILTLTESGFTSRSISKYRPDCPIVAVTASRDVVRKLSLNWGVTAVLYDGERADEAMLGFGVLAARRLGLVDAGDVIVVTAGVSREAGSTNMIRVLTVPGSGEA
jgi:pyruvate kinase